MIEAAILAALTPLQTSIDILTTRVEAWVADDLDTPETLEIPPASIRDATREEVIVDESTVETNDEYIAIQEKRIYRDLPDLGEKIMQSKIHISLTETFMEAPSGSGTAVTFAVTLGTDAQIQTDAPSTYS
ncbi:hypothetical protein H5410_022379 [Solanum commersonii]|uniref:Polyprotein protein n=1 Tax=Solanum commersonii TaxID=4109 RepID=A0A9J5ZEL8_SOLCO|nr:hypothetical protein H5410_022379 [Solanum commersonii]